MTVRVLLSMTLCLVPVVSYGSYNCPDPARCSVVCDGANDEADIMAAIGAVSPGGLVTVAAGACTITSTVAINKPITLEGAGPSSTRFVGTASPMVTVAHAASGLTRVTKLQFNSAVNTAILVRGTITEVRIDNTKCLGPMYCVYSTGRVEGVVDHNEFINCDSCVLTVGSNDASWGLDFDSASGNFRAGSSHMLFIETNRFERNASFAYAGNEVHYAQEGARTVFRYNTVDMRQFTPQTYVHDSHGNQFYYNEAGTFRGQPIHEIYENTFLLHRVGVVIGLRSGANLIFNNEIEIASPVTLAAIIRLVEEEAWSGSGQHYTSPGYDYSWPTEDMITNTFVWGNIVNGAPLSASNIAGATGADCCGSYPDASHVINFDRDVWMHAPQATGGRTYYTGRAGASGRDGDGALAFTTSGANAFYPYTPYAYPHPLTRAMAPPTNLRITP